MGVGRGVGESNRKKKIPARFHRQLLHLLGRTSFPTQPKVVPANYGSAAKMCKRVMVGNTVEGMLVMLQLDWNEVN